MSKYIQKTEETKMTYSNNSNSFQDSVFQLVKPIVNSFFGGTKTLQARVILSGQIENIELIQTFSSFLTVIIHYCESAKLFGAQTNPELYHLRAVVKKSLKHFEYIDFKDITIKPCKKSDSYNSDNLEFELIESSFVDYLQCIPIVNPLYKVKPRTWFDNIVDSFDNNYEDDEIEFEPLSFKASSAESLQDMVNSAIKFIFEPEPQFTVAASINSQFAPQQGFNISTVSQNPNIGTLNSSKLNSYVVKEPISEPIKETVAEVVKPKAKPDPEIVPIPLESQELVHITKPKSFASKILVMCGIGFTAGAILYSSKPNMNTPGYTNNHQVTPIATKPAIKNTTPNYDKAAQLKTYDSVIGSYTSQDTEICEKLKAPPKAVKYGDNKWFAIDNSKYHLCKIGEADLASQNLKGEDLQNFKTSNSASVMNHITQSNRWLGMSK